MAEVYKLLIADDEYWIREQMRILIDWASYGIEFLEPAVDGEDAYEKTKKYQPDILITDINMPFLCGVELVKKIKLEFPETVTLILSGYSDFEYVKESLLAGAIDYILKPVEKMDLIKAFTKALDVINCNKMMEREKKFHRESLLRASAALNDREFSEMIIHQAEKHSFIAGGHQISPKCDHEGFYFLLIKMNNINSLGEVFHYDVNLLSYSIKQHIKERMGDEILFLFNNVYNSNEFIAAVKITDKDLEEQGYRLLLSLHDFTGLFLVIGVSEHHYMESEYLKAYQEAKAAVLAKEFAKKNKVILYSDIKDSLVGDRFLTSEKRNTLQHLIRTEKEKTIDYIRETIGLAHCMEQRWLVGEVRQSAEAVIQSLSEYAKEVGGEPWGIGHEEVLSSAFRAIDSSDQEELIRVLEEYADAVLEEETELPAGSTGKEAIKAIERFIEEHYYEELSLKTLAEMYHMDAGYLSKLFKRECGCNLIHHITVRRMEKAKEMIQTDEKPLTEIAFAVGYDDYNYFNKVFRKTENMSPREYRTKITGKK